MNAVLERALTAIERENVSRANAEMRKFCIEEAVVQTCYEISADEKCSATFSRRLEKKEVQQNLVERVLNSMEEFT